MKIRKNVTALFIFALILLSLKPAIASDYDSLISAIKKNDLKKTEKLIESNPNIFEQKDELGRTVLHHAAGDSNPETVELLLKEGAVKIIDSQDKGGNTPLIWAIMIQRKDNAEKLIEYGAYVDSKNLGDLTAMHFAAQSGNSDLVNLLISNGASINLKTKTGATPLLMAVEWGDPVVIKTMINLGADVNAANQDGTTPMHLASQADSSAMIDLLCKKGANVNVKDKNGYTPLDFALTSGLDNSIKGLIKNGADVNVDILRRILKNKEWGLLKVVLFNSRKIQFSLFLIVSAFFIIIFALLRIRKKEKNS